MPAGRSTRFRKTCAGRCRRSCRIRTSRRTTCRASRRSSRRSCTADLQVGSLTSSKHAHGKVRADVADSLTTAPEVARAHSRPSEVKETPLKIRVEHLNFYYGETRVLHDISVGLHANQVSAFIGPSGCGKSTFLRTLNRMNDIIAGTRADGKVLIDDADIYRGATDVVDLRRRVGMVFQK